MGINIWAPPTFALLQPDAANNIVPSQYAKDAKAAGLDIITWTLERSGILADGNNGFYYRTSIACVSTTASGQTLEGLAVLPADTFAPGPTSGQLIAPANGRVPPFWDKQPVQGFSSVVRASDGDFLVMSDNGFGAKPNSPDYVLRLERPLAGKDR